MKVVEMVRLQKFLADSGVASRRAAEELILAGRVMVNGKLAAKLGTKVDPARDSVKVDGKLIRKRVAKLYVLLNKPAGYVTSTEESEGAPVVTSLMPAHFGRLFPVGRLDLNSEGLLIMTNDGELAQQISHPRNRVVKTYEVKVRGRVDETVLESMKHGVFSEGERLVPLGLRRAKPLSGGAWLEFRLVGGKNREIRRICETMSLRVGRLRRISIGRLRLGWLAPGEWRLVSRDEIVAALR
ncbi:MAG: pseudouridine synthase [Methanobacteriota archaeon]